MAFGQVNNVYTTEETDKSSPYTMGIGEEIKFFQLPAYNDPTFLSNSLSHLWSWFGMRTETDYNIKNVSYANGGLLGTALAELPEAFWNKGGIAFKVDNNNYRTRINGQNIAFYIPLNSLYSGMTSGLTATTLYSSFTYGPDILEKDPTSLCAGVKADSYISEPNPTYTSKLGVGYKYMAGSNPEINSSYPYFDSGLVYLVTDSIYNTFSGATGSSTSWSYLYNQDQKYSKGARTISFWGGETQYTGLNGYDRIVGAMFLDSGLGFIFDPDLVGGFNWSTVSGSPTTISGGTFTSGQTVFDAGDIDVSEILKIEIITDDKTFNTSTNPSYIGLGNNAQDCGVAISTITLHNQIGECLAIVKPDPGALIKNQGDYLVLNCNLPVSGPIQDSLADTRGLIWDGISQWP